MLDSGLKKEQERLENEEYFDKENIGHFYGIFETRPYIRGLFKRATSYVESGKMRLAKEQLEEILKLNNNDNLGARYSLMAVYAFFEDEKAMLKLYKKYPEESLLMLVPFMILYYKQRDYKKAKEYLKRIDKVNPYFRKFFKQEIKEEDLIPTGYYSPGSVSEVVVFLESAGFLLVSVLSLSEFILNN